MPYIKSLSSFRRYPRRRTRLTYRKKKYPLRRRYKRRIPRVPRLYPEKKYADITTTDVVGSTNTDNSPAYGHYIMSCMPSMFEGVGQGARVGLKILVTSIQYSFQFVPQSLTTETITYNIMFFKHKNDIPPQSLWGTGSGGTLAGKVFDTDINGVISTLSFRQRQYFTDIIVLKRIRGTIYSTNSDTSGQQISSRKGYIKLRNVVSYDGSHSVTSNDIYFLITASYGDIASGETTGLSFNTKIRVTYTDS